MAFAERIQEPVYRLELSENEAQMLMKMIGEASAANFTRGEVITANHILAALQSVIPPKE